MRGAAGHDIKVHMSKETPLPSSPHADDPKRAERKVWLDAAVDVARMAAARADTYFQKRTSLVVEEKGPRDFVTIADKKTEELIVQELRQRFPDHAFLGEEQAAAGNRPSVAQGQPLWVIDPIDGTTNFIRGIPLWAVSVGLVVNGEPEVGVIVCPRQDEVFAAARGLGAALYTTPIRTSATSSLASSEIALGAPRRGTIDLLALSERLASEGADLRRLGSACVAIAWTACGRVDAYVENNLSAWDVAAGICLLREAGARTNDVTAGPWLEQRSSFWGAAPGIADALASVVGVPAATSA